MTYQKWSVPLEAYSRYFWKELTDEGKLKDASWANSKGYPHVDEAIVHLHMKFSVETDTDTYLNGSRYTLMKFYGVK